MHSLGKEQKKSTFTVPFLGPSGGTKMRPQNRKIHSKGRRLQQTKNYNWVWNRGGPHMRSLISIDFPAPEMEPESAHVVSAVCVP